MGETIQRNSLRMAAPQVAPYSFGQYGLERPVPMDTTGGLLPAPLAPLPQMPVAPTPDAPPMEDVGELRGPLPFTRDELRGLMGGSDLFRPFLER